MSEEIKETAVKGIDSLFNQLTDATAIVTEKLIDVTPEAAESILLLVQAKGIFELVTSGLFCLLTVLAMLYGFPRALIGLKTDKYGDPVDPMVGALGAVICAVSIFIFIGCLTGLLSFYNWVAAIYPEGAIALRALEAVGITL